MITQSSRILTPRPPHKRSRAIYQCTECRQRKTRCSKSCPRPCSTCVQFSRTCIYTSQTPSRKNSSAPSTDSSPSEAISAPESACPAETPVATSQTHSSIASTGYTSASRPDLNDVCLQLGKLSITERVGGVLRPDMVRILDAILSKGGTPQNDRPQQPEMNALCTPLVAWFKPLPLVSLIRPGPATGEEPPYFPTRAECDIFAHQYFLAVDPIAHLLHKVSFEPQVDEVYENLHHPGLMATKTLILAVCFAAATSMPFLQVQSKLMMSKPALIPQCRAEISRSHSVFVGALIRSAQMARLDELSTGGNPGQIQLRRLVWHQLAFYDLRTAEAQGPSPMLTSYTGEMQYPVNIADQDLNVALDVSQNFEFTQSTFSLIRYECYDIHRQIFRDRERIRRGQVAFPDVLQSIDQRRLHVEDTYLKFLDEGVPVQKCAKMVARLLLARCVTMTVYEQVVKHGDRVLRERYIQSALTIIESGALLETDPDLAPWAWYAGAYQQYHSLFSLLMDLYQDPNMADRERILAMADHVFGSSEAMSSHDRCGMVIRTIRDKLEVLLTSRGFSNVTETPVVVLGDDSQSPLSEQLAWGEGGFAGDDQFAEYLDSIDFSNSWWQLSS
ncbi:uncharacterized protein BDZ99DRAFT_557535 [Mytilinidion resinicola]|uniref:Zn(2)-C6 fungal-type domain-containing protein n=1 Tax=Mytilinidion resinicola TaxID=574789 RepID=A0A6A6YXQ5_9PEZI|nr:uncharacterized protein BDZ99DRAFT_557535 [Mytilinidion resinicola]KAF2813611.1 hypothetical protein BDZ99DRAFT_557535 [Mytilinidion resinicola]